MTNGKIARLRLREMARAVGVKARWAVWCTLSYVLMAPLCLLGGRLERAGYEKEGRR